MQLSIKGRALDKCSLSTQRGWMIVARSHLHMPMTNRMEIATSKNFLIVATSVLSALPQSPISYQDSSITMFESICSCKFWGISIQWLCKILNPNIWMLFSKDMQEVSKNIEEAFGFDTKTSECIRGTSAPTLSWTCGSTAGCTMAAASINGGHSIGSNHNMYIAQEKASNHIGVVSCRVCLSTLLNLLFHILTLPQSIQINAYRMVVLTCC